MPISVRTLARPSRPTLLSAAQTTSTSADLLLRSRPVLSRAQFVNATRRTGHSSSYSPGASTSDRRAVSRRDKQPTVRAFPAQHPPHESDAPGSAFGGRKYWCPGHSQRQSRAEAQACRTASSVLGGLPCREAFYLRKRTAICNLETRGLVKRWHSGL